MTGRQLGNRLIALLHVLLLSACTMSSPPHKIVVPHVDQSVKNVPFDHAHSDFDSLLKKHVKNGLVNYAALQGDPDQLASYLASLAAVEWKTVEKWTEKQQLSYWINAYNAFTIQAIVERYPIQSRSFIGLFFPGNSILQISGVWSGLTFNAAGRSLTLGEIEHEILRKDFTEPRIHFAIVCASTSCPALRSEAYRHDILEKQLHDQTVQFINDPVRGAFYDDQENRLYVSKIFKWFKEDFNTSNTTADNTILAYLSPYFRDNGFTKAMKEGREIHLSYLPYDWHLNEIVNPADSAGRSRENDD